MPIARETVLDIAFVDPGSLVDGDLELRLTETTRADHQRGFDPAYVFSMLQTGSEVVVGNITLRVGHTEHLEMYRGHVGFGVLEPFRGNGYAIRSCRLLAQLATHHNLSPVWLTCNENNLASQRTLLALGAEYAGTVSMPHEYAYIEHYPPEDRIKRRYRWWPGKGRPDKARH